MNTPRGGGIEDGAVRGFDVDVFGSGGGMKTVGSLKVQNSKGCPQSVWTSSLWSCPGHEVAVCLQKPQGQTSQRGD
jgi:hypothetical protein